MPKLLVAALALAATLAPVVGEGQPAGTLVGVWRVAEIASPQGATNTSPQPTLYIFTARHYSHVSVTSSAPRPHYTGPAVTDAQRVQMWQPFSATAGTYELKGSQLTLRPMVAKNPGFMGADSFMTLELTWDGNDVWIRPTQSDRRSLSSSEGNRVRLSRLE